MWVERSRLTELRVRLSGFRGATMASGRREGGSRGSGSGPALVLFNLAVLG